MIKPCLVCGEPTEASRCPAHRRKPAAKASPKERGYGQAWRRLSRQARKLQPWCSTCHTHSTPANPLTVDHTPAAWAKNAEGKPLTLADFAAGLLSVECRRCNIAQGAARGSRVDR